MNAQARDYAIEVRRRSLAAVHGAVAPFGQRVLTGLTLLTPRLAIGLLWFFSHWFDGLFTSQWWPIAGFVLWPTTLLWYTAVQHWLGGAWTLWPVVGIVVALVIDVSAVRGQRRP